MPDRWRNAKGGSEEVLRILGECSLCRCIRYFVMEKTEAYLRKRKGGI